MHLGQGRDCTTLRIQNLQCPVQGSWTLQVTLLPQNYAYASILPGILPNQLEILSMDEDFNQFLHICFKCGNATWHVHMSVAKVLFWTV